MTQGQMPAPNPMQLKVTLVDSEPEVWRQVVVPAAVTLADLHGIIQAAMGWQRLHDHSFQIGLGDEKSLLAEEKLLSAVLIEAGDSPEERLRQRSLYYNYDAENGWQHRLVAEPLTAVETADGKVAAARLPVCLTGEAACPPEGSGGIWGYDQFMAQLEDVEDPDYITLLDQYGDFDPNAFDLAAANARLLR